MCKLTVISPVYNAERYLRQCLDSLVNQTLEDIQIVCVNDGSTDGSLAILEEYAAKDIRIEIVDKQNGGYGSAMNAGLRIAKGKYIAILEPDDFIELDAYERLYAIAEEYEAQIVKCNRFDYDEREGSILRRTFKSYNYNVVFDPHEYQKAMLSAPATCSGVFLRSLIVDNDIWYLESPGAAFQDTSFSLKCWLCASRAIFIDEAFLHYRRDNAAASSNSTEKVFCVCDEYAELDRFIDAQNDDMSCMQPILWAKRFETYQWNYKRIATSGKLDFLQRWSLEFKEAKRKGLIDDAFYTESQKALLVDIIENPALIFEKEKARRNNSASVKAPLLKRAKRKISRLLSDR